MKDLRGRLIELLGQHPGRKWKVTEMTMALGLEKSQRRLVKEHLQELFDEEKVEFQGRLYSAGKPRKKTSTDTGLLHVHPTGRGFVDRGEAFSGVVIANKYFGYAIDGDTVKIEFWQGDVREKGRIVEVLARGRTRLTGVLCEKDKNRLLVDDPRITCPVKVADKGPAKPGQTVLGLITHYPDSQKNFIEIRVSRVLGEPGKLLTEIEKSLAANGVDEPFPWEVLDEARALPKQVEPSDFKNRQDLRHLHFVTIDPLSARDFDDAVAVEEGPGDSLRIWIAVADVSHYVPEGSAIDLEARKRGCSVYLPDRAIPMIPDILSSGICSLVPNQDRLAMVVRLDISKNGQIVDTDFAAAVIHSQGRLDYNGVAAALGGDFQGLRASYRQHADILLLLSKVASALRKKRIARGSLDLDLPEPQVILDEDDPERIRDVLPSHPNQPIKRAYNLIEELMIAANEAVAQEFESADKDAIFRIHPPPLKSALSKLAVWMGRYGITVKAQSLTSEKGIARLVKKLHGHRAAQPLCYLVLRTLKQAVYSAKNVGHFGLASEAYVHFTSPIRRYPDLHVHRLFKTLLKKQKRKCGVMRPLESRRRADLEEIARDSTSKERRSIEVEREVLKVYCTSFMRDLIGESFHGKITGISAFGLFITLDHPFVEGMVKVESFPDWIEFDPDGMQLFSQSSQKTYALGDEVDVLVHDVSVSRRQIELKLLGTSESPPAKARKGRPQRRPRSKAPHKTRKRKKNR